jgi:hypothetical protein
MDAGIAAPALLAKILPTGDTLSFLDIMQP